MTRLTKLALVAALGFAAWNWGQAATIHAKAQLAPILIKRAWTDSRVHHVGTRPWPWADTWPVAKLTIPSLDIEQFILAGANGASLPFGPGHLAGTAEPGASGTVVIAGHRDTHFRFTAKLPIDTMLILEGIDGSRRFYRVQQKEIVDARREDLKVRDGENLLILVTCEPTSTFTARGPYRLVVTAVQTPVTDG